MGACGHLFTIGLRTTAQHKAPFLNKKELQMLIKPNKSNVKLIINLQEVYEIRNRKERELEYYNKELEKLQQKMSFIKQEINLTHTIIDIIETEKVVDLKEYVENKRNESS